MNTAKRTVALPSSEGLNTESKANFPVSSRSHWSDPIWLLDTMTPGRRDRIGWAFLLPDGTRSTDSKHAELLEGFRIVFWGMLHDGLWYGKPLKVGSSGPFGVGMRELFIWMVWRGFESFSSLTQIELERYRDDLPLLILDREAFYSESTGGSLPIAEYHDIPVSNVEMLDGDVDTHDSESSQFESLEPIDQAVGADGHDSADEENGEEEEDDRFSYHQAFIRC